MEKFKVQSSEFRTEAAGLIGTVEAGALGDRMRLQI
jgi:hypothetical protein